MDGVASELTGATIKNLGEIHLGETKTVAYTSSPRYRSFTFRAQKGEEVDFTIHAASGDAIGYILRSSYSTVVRNDNADPNTKDAHIHARIATAGTYYVAFTEAKSKGDTFTVSFNAPVPPTPPWIPANRYGAPFSMQIVCDYGWTDDGRCGSGRFESRQAPSWTQTAQVQVSPRGADTFFGVGKLYSMHSTVPEAEAKFDGRGTAMSNIVTGDPRSDWYQQLHTFTLEDGQLKFRADMIKDQNHCNHVVERTTCYGAIPWDGYAPQRRRWLRYLADRGVANPVVLSGDFHSTWVNDLPLDPQDPWARPVATEFVTPSISSQFAAPSLTVPLVEAVNATANPHTRYFQAYLHGYLRMHVTPQRWLVEERLVPTVLLRRTPVTTRARFVVEAGRPGAVRA